MEEDAQEVDHQMGDKGLVGIEAGVEVVNETEEDEDQDPDLDHDLDLDPSLQVTEIEEGVIEEIVIEDTVEIVKETEEEIAHAVEIALTEEIEGTVDATIVDVEIHLMIMEVREMAASVMRAQKAQEDRTVVKRVKKSLITNPTLKRTNKSR